MLRLMILAVSMCMVLLQSGYGAQVDARTVLDKAGAAYGAMRAFSAQGTVSTQVDSGTDKVQEEIVFSIAFNKPDRYLISWSRKSAAVPGSAQAGAAWNDGAGPYVYLGSLNAYSKMKDDASALSFAGTMLGNGTASGILSVLQGQAKSLPMFANAVWEKDQWFQGQDCYVLSAGTVASQKYSVWISKSTYLVAQYETTFSRSQGPDSLPSLTPEQEKKLQERLQKDFPSLSAADIQKKMPRKDGTSLIKNSTVGGVITERYTQVSSTPNGGSFRFVLPKGAVLKDALIGPIPDKVI